MSKLGRPGATRRCRAFPRALIEDVGGIAAVDRIGPRLRAEGIASSATIDARAAYTVDIELWDAPTRLDRQVRVQNVVTYIEGKEGEVLSRYVGDAGLIVLRARLRGPLLRDMLALPAIARVDRTLVSAIRRS